MTFLSRAGTRRILVTRWCNSHRGLRKPEGTSDLIGDRNPKGNTLCNRRFRLLIQAHAPRTRFAIHVNGIDEPHAVVAGGHQQRVRAMPLTKEADSSE